MKNFDDAMEEAMDKFYEYMDKVYGVGNWSTTFPEPYPKEFDFLAHFLKKKIQITADLWAKLGMKL